MSERKAYLCVKQPKQKYRAAFHTMMAVLYADSRAQAKREADEIFLGVLNCVGNEVTGDDVYKAGYGFASRHCGDYLMTLSSKNDRGEPFTEIADYIEANL